MMNEPALEMPEEAPSAMGNEICVSLAALSQPDEQDQMEPPAVGDKVQANIEGTVSRVEGDNAYITLEAVNGQEVKGGEAAPDELGELQSMAQNMPEEL